MQVGMIKDQGSYNWPSAAVHPGALAAGTLPRYSTTGYTELKIGESFFKPNCQHQNYLCKISKFIFPFHYFIFIEIKPIAFIHYP